MPGFDSRGPKSGPGRGLGPCGNSQRWGRSRFCKRSNFFYTPNNITKQKEIDFLEEQLEALENEKSLLAKKIAELK